MTSVRSRLGGFALLLSLWLRAAPAIVQPAAEPDKPVTLSIVAVNDVHGRLAQLPLLGGYLQNLRAARERDGGAVLLLDAGDIFQGTLESNLGEGAAMVRAYHALGVTAAALGNHELDYGPSGPRTVPLEPGDDPLGAISARVAEAKFPFLSANLAAADGGTRTVPGLRPSLQLTAAGVRVGIVGGLTLGALSQTHADNVRGLSVLPLAESLGAEAARLRKAGAEVVIALVHAGGECGELTEPDDLTSCDADAELFALARALPAGAVDALIGGHTHAGVAHRVAGIPVIESFANGRAFGRIDLRVTKGAGRAIEATIFPPHGLCAEDLDAAACTKESYEGRPVQRDQAVLAAIAGDLERTKALREEPLGVTAVRPVMRASRTESALSNLLADLMLRAFPKADVALNNSGSVRTNLPQGPLRYGHVFEVFPFDNVFATLKITAAELAAVVERSLRGGHGLIALAGVKARARCDGEALRVDIVGRSGRVLPPTRELSLVTSDYVVARGDGLFRDTSAPRHELVLHRDKKVRDALVAGLRAWRGGKLDGQDKRLFDPKRPRIAYPGRRPVRCPSTAAGATAAESPKPAPSERIHEADDGS